MGSIKQILAKVQKALDEPFDLEELNVAMIEMHKALSDEQYVIKDPVIRKEMENMFVSYTVRKMLEQS